MLGIKDHIDDTYWICRKSDNSDIHYGLVDVGLVTTSGQEVKETFTVEQDWIDRLEVLGITV